MEHSKPSNDFAVELIEALQRGDTLQVWHEFLHSYASTIVRVVAFCERDSENRSEAFVFVCEQLHRDNCRRLRRFRCNGPASFNTWLHAVVRNLCRDWRRKTFGRVDPSTSDVSTSNLRVIPLESLDGEEILEKLVDPDPDPTILFDLKQQACNLSEALRSLPAKERLAVLLRTQEELTFQEIASVLALKNAQAADRLVRGALQTLRAYLNESMRLRGKTKAAAV